MPRVARLDTPGLLHHVMVKRFELQRIFNNDREVEISLTGGWARKLLITPAAMSSPVQREEEMEKITGWKHKTFEY